MTVINTPEDLLRLLDENAEFREAARRHILTDELIRLPEKFAQFVNRVEGFIEEQKVFNEEQRGFNRRIETAVGELRGNVARQIVGMYRREIAAELELVYQRAVDRHELFAMLPPLATSGIERGGWHSFYRADLVLEATDQEDNAHYVAIEVSYTGDWRDTNRANRNAALLEQFKGQPAHAVIASVRNDHETQALVDSRSIRWYAMDPADFTPD